MTNFKKIVLSMVVVLLIVAIATVVSATGDLQIIQGSNVDNTSTGNGLNTSGNSYTSIPNTSNNTSNINNTSNTNVSNYNNTNKTNNTNLPKTGAEDYLLTTVIGVLAVSAVVAYKKVKEYKNI